jgi:nucleoside-diphosphate-sugar epimerase
MKVLITGTSGFIAEHLINTLLLNDDIIINALIHIHDKVFPSVVKKFTGDLNDPSTLKKHQMELTKYNIPISAARGLAYMGDIGGRIIRRPLPFNSEVMGKVTGSLTFSSKKITQDTGFIPKYNLYNTINETIIWYKGLIR